MMRFLADSTSSGRNNKNLPQGTREMSTFVIDTISFKCNWPLRLERHNDWRFTWLRQDLPTGEDNETAPFLRPFKAHHRFLGIYIAGANSCIKFVSVSLPRMIHESNALLIQSQQQLDEAFGNLRDFIEEIAETSTPLLYFTRVDLVWQFQHCPAALIRAHQYCVFPRCRPKTKVYDARRSASWDFSDMRIVMYDKRLKDRKEPGNVVRIEIQLHKVRLRQCLATGEERVTELDFVRCYHAFRALMITFAPSQEVATPQTKYEALALIERQAHAAGLASSPIELFLSTMKARTARTWRKLTTAAQLRQENFRWEDVLPESGPPDAIAGY